MSRRILVLAAVLGLLGFLVGQSFAANLYKQSGGKKQSHEALANKEWSGVSQKGGGEQGGGGADAAQIKAVLDKMDLLILVVKGLSRELAAHVELHKHGGSGAAPYNPGGPAEANQTTSTLPDPEANLKKRKEFQGNRAPPATSLTPGQAK